MSGIRLRTFVIFALAAISGAALLHTSQRVQEAEETLYALNADVAREEEAMRVLKAEWEYLNRPERLERLATEFLELAPPAPDRMSESLMNASSALPQKIVPDEDETLTQPVSFSADAQQMEMPVAPAPAPKPAPKPEVEQISKPIVEKSAPDKDLNTLLNEWSGEQ